MGLCVFDRKHAYAPLPGTGRWTGAWTHGRPAGLRRCGGPPPRHLSIIHVIHTSANMPIYTNHHPGYLLVILNCAKSKALIASWVGFISHVVRLESALSAFKVGFIYHVVRLESALSAFKVGFIYHVVRLESALSAFKVGFIYHVVRLELALSAFKVGFIYHVVRLELALPPLHNGPQ